jgi:O-acetyl-ADP-ribose deacetylase (regulator of RNase III)
MLQWLTAKARRWRMKTLKSFGKKASAAGLRLSLDDLSPRTAEVLADAFADADDVEVVEGNGVVSPANSFGDIGGGIDKAIDDFHQGQAKRAVMAAIAQQFLGELPVGAALVVELPARRFPFVVASPTMRVPGSVTGTINAYLSMRAALVVVLRHNAGVGRPIRSLAVPGLCTGVGDMHPAEAAEQMQAAYDSVVGEKWWEVLAPVMAPYALRRSKA